MHIQSQADRKLQRARHLVNLNVSCRRTRITPLLIVKSHSPRKFARPPEKSLNLQQPGRFCAVDRVALHHDIFDTCFHVSLL